MNRPSVEAMDGARELAWAVSRVGCSQRENHEEFAKLVREVEHEWRAVFPRQLGYETHEQRGAGSEVRLTVARGDFVGQVELCCAPERNGSASRGRELIRLTASADSHEVLAARAAGRRAIRVASGVATSIGALLSLGFCWLTIGVESAPLVVGLLLTVVITVLLVGGHALGVRVGEDLAERFELRAELRLDRDAGLQADLKRWNALGRQLRWRRRALARGLSGTPFRRA